MASIFIVVLGEVQGAKRGLSLVCGLERDICRFFFRSCGYARVGAVLL